MVALRIVYDGRSAEAQLQRSLSRGTDRVLRSFRGTATIAAQQIKDAIIKDIQSAGRFGPRWTEGLLVNVSETSGGKVANTDFVIEVSHQIPFFMVHERGALITGRPLLWIPAS